MSNKSCGNAIFIHVQRTAGSSIVTTCNKDPILHSKVTILCEELGHKPAIYIKQRISNFDSMFSFCFIRNPWDRLVSWWGFYKNIASKTEIKSFDEWARYYVVDRFADTHLSWDNQYSCSSFIFNENEEPQITFVGRFENLTNDWNVIVNNISPGYHVELEHMHQGGINKPYRKMYSNKLVKYIEPYVQRDCVNFGYSF